METAHEMLVDAVRRAVGLEAEALTFFSGVGLYITTAAGQQPLRLSQPLSRQRVRDLHEACLALAGRNDLKWLHFGRYRVTFPGLGRFLCDYLERRTTSNLRLQRDPEAPDWVEPRRAPTLPRWAALSLPPPEPRTVEDAAPLP